MNRHPGLVVATVFALGAMLGLATSFVFLSVDANEIRSATETRASVQSGPIAELFLAALDERDIFDRVADDLRADQIRNLQIATVLTAAISVALGVGFGRRALHVVDEGKVGHGRVSDRGLDS